MLPNFLVIGAPRSGTSWIHQNLRQHPQVFIPKTKELHYFDRHYERSIEYYESLFMDWAGQEAVGELTPGYLSGVYSPNRNIPELIRRHLPNVKLIAVLRNPVERAYSHYWHNVSQDARNLGLSFEDKLQQRPQILQEGFYFEHLARYLSLFPRRQMLILLYDDLTEDPFSFLRQIYEFLGVDPHFRSGVESLNRNAAQGKGHLARSRLLLHIGRAFAKTGFIRASERLRRANSVGPLPPMKPETRQKLVELYRPKNAQLSAMIGRDLSLWDERIAPQ